MMRYQLFDSTAYDKVNTPVPTAIIAATFVERAWRSRVSVRYTSHTAHEKTHFRYFVVESEHYGRMVMVW